MNSPPDANKLLAIARAALLAKLMPRLPDELRYDALMIANAMAIAIREHAAGDTAAQAELARLQTLLAEPRQPLSGDLLEAALAECNRRLATGIRAGRYDIDNRAALLDHLAQTAAAELAVSNPRALES